METQDQNYDTKKLVHHVCGYGGQDVGMATKQNKTIIITLLL